MEKEARIKQGQEMREAHQSNHFANLRIFHGWLNKRFFHKGAPRQSAEEMYRARRSMRRITDSGRR